MIPANRTVLGLDLACDRDDAVYNASDEELARLVLPALEEAGLVQPRDVLEVFSRRFGSAYPIYGLGYAQRQAPAFAWLGQLPNLWLLGRQGLYLHNNTHHSLLMGYQGADAIRQQTRAAWPTRLAEFATFRVAD
jgi:protoporphyrinogen oxidase